MRLVWKDMSGLAKKATLKRQYNNELYTAMIIPMSDGSFVACVSADRWNIDKGFKKEGQAKAWASKILKQETAS